MFLILSSSLLYGYIEKGDILYSLSLINIFKLRGWPSDVENEKGDVKNGLVFTLSLNRENKFN